MTVPAIGYAFKECRTAAAACFRRGLLHRFVHGFDIVAIDGLALESISGTAHGELFHRDALLQTDSHRVLIVLANIDNRQLPNTGEIHRLMDNSLVDRTVAKEAGDDFLR